MGVFLIDVYCLGVKDAFYVLTDEAGLERFLRDIDSGDRKMGQYSAAWGRKLVEEAIGYARKLGFAPHRDYKKAARVMGGINPKDCEETFVFGMNGKPFFTGGPRDTQAKCERILSELIRRRLAADGDAGKSDRPRFYTRQPWTGQGPTDTASNHDAYLYGP